MNHKRLKRLRNVGQELRSAPHHQERCHWHVWLGTAQLLALGQLVKPREKVSLGSRLLEGMSAMTLIQCLAKQARSQTSPLKLVVGDSFFAEMGEASTSPWLMSSRDHPIS